MKNMFKRIVSLLMVLVLAGSMLPVTHAHGEETKENTVLTDEDYAIVNDVFAQIDAMEDAPAKKSASRTQITDAAAEIVMASENYVEGSLERNGNSFTWWTDEGIRCIYNPYMREKYDRMEAPANPEPAGIYNAPKATKGGWPTGNQVYLIAPYYGLDSDFTDQYKNEASSIASAIGDTDGYTLCSGSAVTVDTVADAIENGAVVIFDSHGTTDYDGAYVCDDPDGYEVYDYVSEAEYSYLCLTNKTGLTTDDYNAGATYFTDADGYMCACINGAAIANHMDKNSPAGMLWMAICLGMATDTMCEPMRNKGVEVVYGYSQSVTFAGDYRFEETFWDNMLAGKDVASSIAAMKSRWGNWDWSEEIAASYGYSGSGYTLSEARKYRSAFPIVVSDEDTHPGQRDAGTNYGACSEQTVKSTYTLFSQYAVTAQSNNTAYGTVSVSGDTITATPAAGYFAESATVVSGTATVSQNGNTFTVVAESDCTVQINFAPKTAVTVNFSGANVSGLTGYAGDAMALPTAEAPEGYKFVGWTTAPLSSETTEKPDYHTDSFIPTKNTTLYALYSYVDTTSGGGSGDYVKVTSTPDDWSGEYLIVYESGTDAYIFNSVDASNGYLSATIGDDTIESNATTDAEVVTIEAMSGGYAIKSKNGYIYGTSGANKLNFNTSSQQLNTLSMAADGTVLITSNTSVLRFNATSGQYRFRYYKAASYAEQKGVVLYVKDGSAGTTYYTSTLCDHTKVNEVAAVAPTCTESGYTAGTQCADCGSYVTGHEVIAALGHSWSDWTQTIAPGCESAGEQIRTCGSCGETETQSVSATGHSYADGICSVCGEAEPVVEGYVKTDISHITADQKVIITMEKDGTVWALSNDQGTSKAPAAVVVTVDGDKIVSAEDDILWNIKNSSGSLTIYPDGGTDTWLYCTNTNNGVRVGTNTNSTFEIDSASGYLMNTATSRYLGVYTTTPDWRCYTNTTGNTAGQTLAFYVWGGGSSEPDTTEPEVTEPEVTEPEVTEPEVTEPEVTEPPASEPTGSTTQLQYVFSNYTAGTQYAQGEIHKLDDVVTLTINGAHLNGNIRLYAGSNIVFTSTKEIDSIIVNAGNKAGTLNVYASADGLKWELVSAQATTASYVNYDFDIPAECYYVKLESVGAQIRIPEMTISVIDVGSTEPEVTEPESSEPETPVSGVVVDGNYVIHTANGIAMTALPEDFTYGYLPMAEITINSGAVSGHTDENVFELIYSGNGTYIILDTYGRYLYQSGSYNSFNVSAELPAEGAYWIVTANDDGTYAIVNAEKGKTVAYSSNHSSFGSYENVGTYDAALILTAVVECEHINTETVTVNATCTVAGSTTVTCSDCGATVSEEAIAALGHSFVNGTCSVCGEAEPESGNARYYIAAIRSSGNYFYMSGNLTTGSTKRYQAVDSGLSVLPESISEPDADKVFVLIDNGDGTYSLQAEGVAGDNYLGWTSGNSGALVSEASALKLAMVDNGDGTVSLKFNDGSADRFLSLNATVNTDYFAWYKSGQISNLSLIPVVEEVELIAGMSMVLGADLQVNMHLNVREDVIVNVGGKDTSFAAEELTEDEDGTYVATVSVAAAQMTEIITVRLAGEEIDPYAPAYSIRAYADAILADSQYSEYHALVKEMLNYGGKAQLYFDPDAEDLANAGITGVEAGEVPESTTELSVSGTVEGISFYAASLVYRDKVALRFYFKTTAEAISGYTFKANGKSCTPVQKGDYYYIEVADITPDKLDQQVTVVVTGAGEADLTVSYSPMNYIVRMSAKGSESLKALLKALYNYHLAAKALVNAI